MTRPRLVLALAGGLLVIGGSVQLWRQVPATHEPAAPAVLGDTVTADSDPSEQPVGRAGDYDVPAGQPKTIRIPSIGVDGLIQKVGVTPGNAIAAPNNVHLAGWYTASVRPGDDGLSIIDGHVSGRYSDGVFKRLHTLTIGDSFEILFGDGSVRSFRVVTNRQVGRQEADHAVHARSPEIQKQLNLVSCSGRYDKVAGTYEQRTIIVSERIQ